MIYLIAKCRINTKISVNYYMNYNYEDEKSSWEAYVQDFYVCKGCLYIETPHHQCSSGNEMLYRKIVQISKSDDWIFKLDCFLILYAVLGAKTSHPSNISAIDKL